MIPGVPKSSITLRDTMYSTATSAVTQRSGQFYCQVLQARTAIGNEQLTQYARNVDSRGPSPVTPLHE